MFFFLILYKTCNLLINKPLCYFPLRSIARDREGERDRQTEMRERERERGQSSGNEIEGKAGLGRH